MTEILYGIIIFIIGSIFGWLLGVKRTVRYITDALIEYWMAEKQPKWHKIFRIIGGKK